MSSSTVPTMHPKPFDFGVRLGIFLMVESASLSAIATSILLVYIGFRIFRRYQEKVALRKWSARADLDPRTSESDASDSSFFICLMIAELIQAIGGMLNIKWIIDAFVTEGAHCTTQGVLKQLGDVGVAFMSLAIATQTFLVLVFRWHAPAWTSKYVIAAISTFIALTMGISFAVRNGRNGGGEYYGSTGYWCWIRPEYEMERIVFEYLWMWVAASVMLILYGVIALVMRGILVVDGKKWKFNWRRKARELQRKKFGAGVFDLDEQGEEERQSKAVANLMLFYPAVYIFCVFPVSLVRFLAFGHHPVPPAATIFSSFLFSSSGLLNTILYVITRPELVKGGTPDIVDNGSYDMGAGRSPGKQFMQKRDRKGVNPIHHHFGYLPDRDLDPPSSTGGLQVYVYEQDDNPWTPTSRQPTSSGPGSSHGLGHPPEHDAGGPGLLPDFDTIDTPARNPRGLPHHDLLSISDEQQHSLPPSHQKLVSLDMGFLPDFGTLPDHVHNHGSPREGFTHVHSSNVGFNRDKDSVPPLGTYLHH